MEMDGKKYFVLILSIILIVGFVFMAMNIKKQNQAGEVQFPEQEITQIETQSQSDELDEIEKDLMNTDVDSLDNELSQIEEELNY